MRGGSRVVGSARRGTFLPIINNLLTAIGRLDYARPAAEQLSDGGRKEGDRLSISWTRLLIASRAVSMLAKLQRPDATLNAPIMIRRLQTLHCQRGKRERSLIRTAFAVRSLLAQSSAKQVSVNGF